MLGCVVWYCGIYDLYPILTVNGSTSIEWVDDDLECVDNVLHWVISVTPAIIGPVIGGSGVNVLSILIGFIFLVLNGNIPSL